MPPKGPGGPLKMQTRHEFDGLLQWRAQIRPGSSEPLAWILRTRSNPPSPGHHQPCSVMRRPGPRRGRRHRRAGSGSASSHRRQCHRCPADEGAGCRHLINVITAQPTHLRQPGASQKIQEYQNPGWTFKYSEFKNSVKEAQRVIGACSPSIQRETGGSCRVDESIQ
jgi:hypothetical protein